MSVVVVATITPLEGHTQEVLDGFTEVIPLVHEEPGCELYAAHTDGNLVVMVERWSSANALAAHSSGAALVKLNEIIGGHLAVPPVVLSLQAVPAGEPGKGVIA